MELKKRLAHTTFKLNCDYEYYSNILEFINTKLVTISDIRTVNNSTYITFTEYCLKHVNDAVDLYERFKGIQRNYAGDLITMDAMKRELEGLKGKGAVWQCSLCSSPPYSDPEPLKSSHGEHRDYWKETRDLKRKSKSSRKKSMDVQPDEEKVEADILPFHPPKLDIITGGKDSGGDNWLLALEEGAIFHSRNKKEPSSLLEQWHVQVKWGIGVVLHSNFPQLQEVTILVDSRVWSRQNDKVEVILEHKQELRYD